MTVTVYRSDDASAPVLSGTAGSLITVLDAILVNGYGSKAAVGWSKVFSGTNKAVYRAPSGNRMYLRIDDANTTDSRLIGYETMSDVDTGTGAFPTEVTISGGMYHRKSIGASATARPWIAISNGLILHFVCYYGLTALVDMGTAANGTAVGFTFGEYPSYKSGDAYNSILIASSAAGTQAGRFATASGQNYAASSGHYGPRSYTQTGTSKQLGRVAADLTTSQTLGGGVLPGFPDPITGGLSLAPIYIVENGPAALRGVYPGVWAPMNDPAGAALDTFSGAGDLSGRTFLSVVASNGASNGRVYFEISDTW